MKLKLFFAFLFCLKISLAQVVFCPLGAAWTSLFNQWLTPPEIETVRFTGTTTINSEQVKELTHKRFFHKTNFHTNFRSTFLKQKGDTVFMLNSATKNKWQILYNFAAQVNDFWVDSLQNGSVLINYTTTVISIQTVTINGANLKQLSVNQINNKGTPFFQSFTITEHLGASTFIFPFEGKAFSDGDALTRNLCYQDSELGNYMYGNECLYQSSEQFGESKEINIYKLHPNPFKQSIIITGASNQPTTFSIFNLQGKCCFKIILAQPIEENTVDVGFLASGIYIAQIETEKGQQFMKLLKE